MGGVSSNRRGSRLDRQNSADGRHRSAGNASNTQQSGAQEGGSALRHANSAPSGTSQNFYMGGAGGSRGDGQQQRMAQNGPSSPPMQHHTCTIKNDINLKKLTLECFQEPSEPHLLRLRFTFDSAVESVLKVYCCAVEIVHNNGRITFHRKGDATRNSENAVAKQTFKKGFAQKYVMSSKSGIDLRSVAENQLQYQEKTEPSVFPIVLHFETMPGEEAANKNPTAVCSQTTYAEISRTSEGELEAKVIKQKIQVGGNGYELHEIYGIDHQADQTVTGIATQIDADGKDCVICMSAQRDTTVLPCRHMCMCNECAQVLRYQSSKCPICRCQVESLLQIKVNKKSQKSGEGSKTASADLATSSKS